MAMVNSRKSLPPIDAAALQAMALRYVERFATSSGRLQRFLAGKLRQRGWAGDTPPDLDALIARLVQAGYVDDAAFAGARSRSMAARGLGSRRVAAQLSADGVGDAAPAALAGFDALSAALRFAQKKRLGPWGPPADRAAAQKALGAMLRAGHPMDVARAVLRAQTPEAAAALAEAP
jgi:regulatory protein